MHGQDRICVKKVNVFPDKLLDVVVILSPKATHTEANFCLSLHDLFDINLGNRFVCVKR